MAEPGIKANASVARASRSAIERAKSYSDIEAQRRRIEEMMRDAYYDAEQIDSNSERRAEIARLNGRMRQVNGVAQIYQRNITEQPSYQADTEELRRTYREGGRSPEEARETSMRINEIRARRNNRKYSRSVYMGRRNNRRS